MQEIEELDTQIMLLERIRRDLRGMHPPGNPEAGSEGHFPLRANTLRKLRVAAVVDPFTRECFAPECELTELTPDGWREELEIAQPDLVFLESAWRGKDDLWRQKISLASEELHGLADCCHARKIPFVFWSKEDPVHRDVFMHAAMLADVVFTTDIGSIAAYRQELGHDRVYHLHFAAQPLLHNPIETRQRMDRFCFAGSYPHRYPERCSRFDEFASYFVASRGLDIYDRNYLSEDPGLAFPEQYAPHILGNLPPSEIETAYKGYLFGINMNSVTQSQTMFARRVFELMASNTIVVGNYSKGVKNYFGDLTICTDDAGTMRRAIESCCADPERMDKLRLAALRQVLRYHLYEDRLAVIVERVFGKKLQPAPPRICVFSYVAGQAQADRVAAMFRRQSYGSKRLVLACDERLNPPGDEATVASRSAWEQGSLLGDAEYIACFHPSDWYGENYLLDMALATRYGDFDAIGKGTFYAGEHGTAIRKAGTAPYTMADGLPLRQAMARASCCANAPHDDHVCRLGNMLSIDPFNYCRDWGSEACPAAADLEIYDRGIPMARMEKACHAIGQAAVRGIHRAMDAAELAALALPKDRPVSLRETGGATLLESGIPKAKRWTWIDICAPHDISPYLDEHGCLPLLVDATCSPAVRLFCRLYDRTGAELDQVRIYPGRHRRIEVPPAASSMQLRIALVGTGCAAFHRIVIGDGGLLRPLGGQFLAGSDSLALVPGGFADGVPERDGKLHEALLALRARGCLPDVLELRSEGTERFRECGGIPVIEGTVSTLAAILATGGIRAVCVCGELGKAAQDVLDAFRPVLRVTVLDTEKDCAQGLEAFFSGNESNGKEA